MDLTLRARAHTAAARLRERGEYLLGTGEKVVLDRSLVEAAKAIEELLEETKRLTDMAGGLRTLPDLAGENERLKLHLAAVERATRGQN